MRRPRFIHTCGSALLASTLQHLQQSDLIEVHVILSLLWRMAPVLPVTLHSARSSHLGHSALQPAQSWADIMIHAFMYIHWTTPSCIQLAISVTATRGLSGRKDLFQAICCCNVWGSSRTSLYPWLPDVQQLRHESPQSVNLHVRMTPVKHATGR